MEKEAFSCCKADNGSSCSINDTRAKVQDYYGKALTKTSDLKTNACTTDSHLPDYIRPILELLSEEVISKYYGCGICMPELLEGCKVLDLGCGSGRDCYIISKLVGPTGRVVGVDMTPEQLEIARSNGYIEKLDDMNLEDNYFNCVVSNCVINLSPDKNAVIREAYRVLEPGGELYFSDVYVDRRVPQELLDDEVLYGECLSGALYWNDFLMLAHKHGFVDPRLILDLDCACEDYGQAVIYKGSIETSPKVFVLDERCKFEKDRVVPVCRNTMKLLHGSRFKDHFDFIGNGRHTMELQQVAIRLKLLLSLSPSQH